MKVPVVSMADGRFVRFLVVGVVNTVIGYGIFCGLFAVFGYLCSYRMVAIMAHFIAAIIAYQLHRKFVFNSLSSWWHGFVKYNISLLFSLFVGLILLSVLVGWGGLHPVIAQALTIPPTVVMSYVLHRYFSFRIGRPASNG